MNRYIAYTKEHSSWQQLQLSTLITAEEALITLKEATMKDVKEGKYGGNKYWLTGIAAARAVLTGHSSTQFTHISPIKENREIKYMFSYNSIY
jgi:nickel-dependent lactate racemase